MKTHRSYLFPLLLAAPLAFPSQALAAATRTWVSSAGSDANIASSCSFALPCATFQAAFNVTTAGGEIDAENSGDFGPVVINQAVTIDGGGYIAAINATSLGVAISIQANAATDTVTLRNLSVNIYGNAGNFGILFQSAHYLRIEHVSVNCQYTGLLGGLFTNTGSAGEISLNDVRIQNATYGVYVYGAGNKLSINNSFLANNQYGLVATNGGLAQVQNCVFAFNTIAAVSTTGLLSTPGGTVQLAASTITDNALGLQTTGSGASLISFGNNAIFGNTVNGSPTGTTTLK